ncbi:beta-1,3 glucan biosynthesis-related protein [Trichosporon asahii var. asahii CBS 8904]|uniref:Beta-1,3 glucan biosynthesis-related protein n=1 Tax=Trichosporon asahii var. asahii (strain CBS 8904) TaxID=1220162 RepID=K1VSU2_TRIAC|nr:beta-1,3 glucan biosynthesis-related protein [Trichosporon asahii var. asahii CBS 8904]
MQCTITAPANASQNPQDSPGPSRRASGQFPAGPSGAASGANYPPLSHTFYRLRNVLAGSYPELIESLNFPATQEALQEFEQMLGSPLPPAVRESFLQADGQDLEANNPAGIFYGLQLLPLDEAIREWTYWRQVEADPSTGANPAVLATMASIPPKWIKSEYASRGWIPLLSDRSGNYVGVDLDPGPGGAWGQVIIFGRDFDRKCVMWRGDGDCGWGTWLSSLVDELEAGDAWEVDNGGSDDEEEIGYESYTGGRVYGEGAGLGIMKLTGEYKGWAVLEAWWDRSVGHWEKQGLGMDVEEIERGLEESRRLATVPEENGKGKAPERSSLDMSAIRADYVLETPLERGNSTEETDSMLRPTSPDSNAIPRILHPPRHSPSRPQSTRPSEPSTSASARMSVASSSTDDHPLKPDSEFLSPPTAAQARKQKRPPPPRPVMIDLPTRADVQAAQAVALAEESGLRGGWVMNLDTSAGAAQRRARGHGVSPSLDAEMVDIDLEAGRGDMFGASLTAAELEKQREEDRLSLAGIEQRRGSGSRSPSLLNMVSHRAPSPLARSTAASPPVEGSLPSPLIRSPVSATSPPPNPNSIRVPPTARSPSPAVPDQEREVVRAGSRRGSTVVRERENSSDSRAGLLERTNSGSGRNTPSNSLDKVLSPTSTSDGVAGNLTEEPKAIADLADGMEEVALV